MKVTVMLKANRKTECVRIRKRVDLFGRDVQILYSSDVTSDQHFKSVVRKNRFRLSR